MHTLRLDKSGVGPLAVNSGKHRDALLPEVDLYICYVSPS